MAQPAKPTQPPCRSNTTKERELDNVERSPVKKDDTMKPFFTKKQKKLMRERKLKLKRALQGDGPSEPNNGSNKNKNRSDDAHAALLDLEKASPKNASSTAGPSPGAKRRRTESIGDESPAKAQNKETSTAAADGAPVVVVAVPSNLSGKDAKKFRKDARRKHRDEGKEVKFVDEKEASAKAATTEERNHSKRRKVHHHDDNKPAVPRINDLVQEAKVQSERQKKLQSISEEEEKLPEAYKHRYVALDCEMVGIGTDGKTSVLARVSIVDWDGEVLLDTYVQVESKVVDFRTQFSGIKPKHIKDAMKPEIVRQRVADLVKDKVLVGHALHNDLHALLLTHPKGMIRDTAKYRPFQRYHGKWRPRKLRDLVKEHLGKTIQEGSHDSVTDAASTMELFRLVRAKWERELEEKAKKTSKDRSKSAMTKS